MKSTRLSSMQVVIPALHPFQRLQADLEKIISQTRSGERLLTEPILAKQLGVSRSTLREAMRTFEAQGRIRRQQGIGTFVVDKSPVIESGLEKLESIESLARRINLPVSMGHLSIEHIRANEKLAKSLKVLAQASLVKLSRIIHVEKRPVAYLMDILPEGLLSEDDLEKGFTGSVLDLIHKNGNVQPEKSFTEIQADAADSFLAHALQIQRGDVLLHFTADLFSQSAQVLDHSESYFLPGYFRFHVVRTVGV
jgi:GntR family transcriptional regulator